MNTSEHISSYYKLANNKIFRREIFWEKLFFIGFQPKKTNISEMCQFFLRKNIFVDGKFVLLYFCIP